MTGTHHRFNAETRVLHQRAVRTPLPDLDAERVFHEHMMAVADARERRAELLADPDVPLLDAHETEFERLADTFERRCRHIAGENYEEVAMAYYRGDRDDRIGRLTAYYVEGLWRIQQRTTVSEFLFFPLILRYPDSFTVNVRFASGYTTPESVRYESAHHLTEDLCDEHAEAFYEDSQYSQRQAAEYISATAQRIREAFPDPDETAFEERKYGGIVGAGGRRGTTFTTMLERVDPERDRFTDTVTQSTLVEAGAEARRTEQAYLADDEVVI
ncbi:hypothetical protein [Halopiger aswanensis]|uniref:Uncharacterized protein n=1 Tax=Halopiger aswanensis TaxID=148449 RepID=A0A3R7GKJ9_9EURY|nr:hypothetical protein [Halopiger aswanensis]RKD97414.1 hypothetical protein ATJ93_0400 [Halopiger aswanensis]